ncbi:TasA family protein [Ruminococcus sp.]|uniref:TasA family protein n=1 Tax=Ruminococcus sp. TaxID=41978 RepID=UPI0025FFE166|nr:TasA family protein [Ruminococcus sp.]MBQ6251966.1 hypothetical protein [Ruminococcus sp.]
MDKKKLIAAAAAGGLLLLCSLAVAYFTDHDTKNNVFTVGNVALELNEEHFIDGQLARADIRIDKDPTVKNTGKNDEFVFLEVKVPKGEITLLGSDGKPAAPKSSQELFSFFGGSGAQTVSGSDNFAYNSSTSSADGWVFLEKTAAADEDTYVFGYSTAISPDEETVSLFDKFALRKFIEEEIAGGTKLTVPVNAYGIQASSLDGVSGLPESGSLSVQNLKDIFEICRNKQN